jgi:AcrR family transcriptional regulator
MGMGFLADSNITKRALASAFKELMESQPFSKISVGEICEKCEMN